MLQRSPVTAGRRTLTFRLPGDHGRISVCGTFNDWTPGVLVMEHAADGWLEASVTVAAAEPVVFRYRSDRDWWFDELDADAITGEGSVVEPEADAAALADEEMPGAAEEAVPDEEHGVPEGPAGVVAEGERPETPADVAVRKEAKLRKKRAKMAQQAEERRREIEKKRIAAEKRAKKKAEEAEAHAIKVAREAEKAKEAARKAVAKAAKKAQEARMAHRLQAERRARASQEAAAAAAEVQALRTPASAASDADEPAHPG
ncbi:hypothetical protein [Propioniciclava soli]|uniref:AMP-activated protein kinase glycogen-binding domain-containing protein n=1 Tax=Propioniciclava soli TaxID=2775081 RepID=A0ABZ3C611_9ACTN|nr:hypothetical protein [Propioniciclava soli]